MEESKIKPVVHVSAGAVVVRPDHIVCNDGKIPEEILVRDWNAGYKAAFVLSHGDSMNGLDGSRLRGHLYGRRKQSDRS